MSKASSNVKAKGGFAVLDDSDDESSNVVLASVESFVPEPIIVPKPVQTVKAASVEPAWNTVPKQGGNGQKQGGYPQKQGGYPQKQGGYDKKQDNSNQTSFKTKDGTVFTRKTTLSLEYDPTLVLIIEGYNHFFTISAIMQNNNKTVPQIVDEIYKMGKTHIDGVICLAMLFLKNIKSTFKIDAIIKKVTNGQQSKNGISSDLNLQILQEVIKHEFNIIGSRDRRKLNDEEKYYIVNVKSTNLKHKDESFPLFKAVYNGCSTSAKLMLSAGADPSVVQRNADGVYEDIFQALEAGREARIRYETKQGNAGLKGQINYSFSTMKDEIESCINLKVVTIDEIEEVDFSASVSAKAMPIEEIKVVSAAPQMTLLNHSKPIEPQFEELLDSLMDRNDDKTIVKLFQEINKLIESNKTDVSKVTSVIDSAGRRDWLLDQFDRAFQILQI